MTRTLDATMASDLWFFRVVAERKSITHAAHQLAVTQSAITQRIHRLEERLGVKLFDRTNKGVELTEAGDALFRDARRGFDLIATGISNVRVATSPSTVTINCIPSLALEWLTRRLPAFTRSYPHISLTLLADMNLIDNTQMGVDGIDVAIRYAMEPPQHSRVVAEFAERLYPVGTPDYIARCKAMPKDEPVTLIHDAAPWPNAPSQEAEWAMWIAANGRPWQRPTSDVFFNLAHLAYQAALGGAGLAMGRHLLVAPYIAAKRLVPLAGQVPAMGPRYFIVTRPNVQREEIDLFVTWLTGQMRGIAGSP